MQIWEEKTENLEQMKHEYIYFLNSSFTNSFLVVNRAIFIPKTRAV